MPHVLVAGRVHPAGVALLKSTPGFTFDLVDDVTLAAFVPFIGTADALLLRTQPLAVETITKAPRLKIVSRHGVGYDAVDVAALTARKIPLAIVGDVNSRAVAEHTLALMLAAARKVVAHDAAVRKGNWGARNAFSNGKLDGKLLFLIGFGRIGKAVAKLAQAFGMRVIANDPYVSADAMAALDVAHVADIATALPLADFLSLHMPAFAGYLIGEAELAMMKPTAILINAARGGLIDETALDEALRNNIVAAAALDVFVEEPPKVDHPLLSNAKTTISPHSAGLTQECAARMSVMAVRNIIDFYAGRLNPALVVNAQETGIS
jgi:D-3-phosphoglycerate dehydrogenase / 2-oxoglutarate reductase